jgi:acyl-CoA reductase-like NAD-dependent aldehyde dehydrogenase
MTTLQCLSPIDGSVFATRETLSLDQARGQIEEAKRAQKAWAQVPLDDRITQVMAGVANLGAMNEEITVELAHMMGRPVRYGGEFGAVQERADYMAGLAPSALAPTIIEDQMPLSDALAREPMGLVLDHRTVELPLSDGHEHRRAGADRRQCGADQTCRADPFVGERIAQAFHQAGMPEELIANIFIDHPTAETLLGEGAFDYVNFTGSVEGGRRVERAAAGTFTSMSFELGGKDAGYVMEDADLDAAVETLIDGAIFNSGQCCCGIERIYVTATTTMPSLKKPSRW